MPTRAWHEPSAREAARIAARLLAKYVEILALRDAHAVGQDPPDVLARLRALSRQFPGALRELDRLARPVLVTRIESLERVLVGAPLAPWMQVSDRAHRWLRVAIRRPHLLREQMIHGRRVPAVYARVAAELGMTSSEVRDLVERPEPHGEPGVPPR